MSSFGVDDAVSWNERGRTVKRVCQAVTLPASRVAGGRARSSPARGCADDDAIRSATNRLVPIEAPTNASLVTTPVFGGEEPDAAGLGVWRVKSTRIRSVPPEIKLMTSSLG